MRIIEFEPNEEVIFIAVENCHEISRQIYSTAKFLKVLETDKYTDKRKYLLKSSYATKIEGKGKQSNELF